MGGFEGELCLTHAFNKVDMDIAEGHIGKWTGKEDADEVELEDPGDNSVTLCTVLSEAGGRG